MRSASAAPLILRTKASTTRQPALNSTTPTIAIRPDGLANLAFATIRDRTEARAAAWAEKLPGDLGRPILNAGALTPHMPRPATGPSPEEQRIAQEQEAARREPPLYNDECRSDRVGFADTDVDSICSRKRRIIRPHRLRITSSPLLNGNVDRSDNQPRSNPAVGQSIRAAGWRGDSGVADHGSAIGSAGSSHRTGD